MSSRSLEIDTLRALLRANAVQWQQHVIERLLERDIRRIEVLEVLLKGRRIEDYPDDYPWPSALFLGEVAGRPLHVVAALSPERHSVAIITAYEPDIDHFEADFVTRKRK